VKGFFDYHSHAPWCRHAEGPLEAYAQRALALGLEQLGMSDHLPWPKDEHLDWTMKRSELPDYVAEVRGLQENYKGKLEILLAVEADYVKGQEAETKKLLETAPWDYVIGSVHVLNGWGLDDSKDLSRWEKGDVNQIWMEYFEALAESAATGLFHIIGHCDVAKKFNFRPSQDMRAAMKRVAESFAKAGVIAEINSSGLRKPCKEIYPSLEFLKILRSAGVSITLGSDAHKPEDVGADFQASVKLARDAGYESLQRWDSRGLFRPCPLP
jgi:histidinol-phosphatase (PHP family)